MFSWIFSKKTFIKPSSGTYIYNYLSVRYFLVTETYIGRHWGLTQSLSVVTWYMPADLKMKATSNMCPFESQVSFYSGAKKSRVSSKIDFLMRCSFLLKFIIRIFSFLCPKLAKKNSSFNRKSVELMDKKTKMGNFLTRWKELFPTKILFDKNF